MAARQQPLRFELPDDSGDEEAEWQTGDSFEEEDDEDWGHDADSGEEEWHADDRAEDESFDEPSLSWENSGPTLHDREEEVEEDDDAFARPTAPPLVDGRNRLLGRAVLSVAACLGLVWAANNLPGPDSDTDHGRDSKLFAERLSSRPEDILRLARTTEAADADAQVKAWLAQPRPVRAAEPMVVAKPAAPAVPSGGATAVAVRDEPMGPAAPVVASADVPRTESPVRSEVAAPAKPVAVASNKAPSKPAAATAKASAKSPTKASAKAPAGPVYTVQLGAFKARSNAEQFATKLRGKPSRIVRDGSLYRVVSGSFSSKRDAVVHEASLKRAGFSTYVTTAVF